jgi:hypothetical protein
MTQPRPTEKTGQGAGAYQERGLPLSHHQIRFHRIQILDLIHSAELHASAADMSMMRHIASQIPVCELHTVRH